MSDGETAKDSDPGLDDVGGWVRRGRESVNSGTKHLEGTNPEGDDQTLLGAEQAVDSARLRTDLVGHPPNGERFQTGHLHDPFGCLEQRLGGPLIVFSWPAHPWHSSVTLLRYGVCLL